MLRFVHIFYLGTSYDIDDMDGMTALVAEHPYGTGYITFDPMTNRVQKMEIFVRRNAYKPGKKVKWDEIGKKMCYAMAIALHRKAPHVFSADAYIAKFEKIGDILKKYPPVRVRSTPNAAPSIPKTHFTENYQSMKGVKGYTEAAKTLVKKSVPQSIHGSKSSTKSKSSSKSNNNKK